MVVKKEKLDQLKRNYIQGKSFNVIEFWECERLRLQKTTSNVKQHIREGFPRKRSLTEYQLLEKTKRGFLWLRSMRH